MMLKQKYIESDNLYDFVKQEFGSYEEWLEYEEKKQEEITSWETERLFRIIESSKEGLINQSIKGNAAAVSHLRSLLNMKAPVGRPRGKRSETPEMLAAIEADLQAAYLKDVGRLQKII